MQEQEELHNVSFSIREDVLESETRVCQSLEGCLAEPGYPLQRIKRDQSALKGH
jgi:hypothetical protein